MRRPTSLRLLSLTLLLATSSACASGGPASPAPASPAPDDRPSLERLEALYQARMDSTRMNVHPADVDFMTGMIAHHAQALVMSAWAPDRAATESIKTLAARITNAQKDEIHVMQRWLRERDRPVPQVGEAGQMDGHHTHTGMPGILSQEQLDRLEASRGETFDSLYLAYMIPHHQGAVTMVNKLFATDGAAQNDFVFKLASDVQVDQSSEIARMQRMLDAMRPEGPE